MFSTSDAVGSVTWFSRPPVETVTDNTIVHTNSTKLRKGSAHVYLNREFSLTNELSTLLAKPSRLCKAHHEIMNRR